MKRTLIYLTITLAIFTVVTALLMISVSGTTPIKLYWAVDCLPENENSCNLKISGINFVGENEELEVPTFENNYTASGSLTPAASIEIDKPSKVPWYSYRNKITSITLGGEEDTIVPASMFAWFYGMENLQTNPNGTDIDFSHVDSTGLSNSTNLSYLFYGCSSLNDLDLSPLRINNTIAGASENVYSYTYLDSVTLSANTILFFEYGFWKDENSNITYYYDSGMPYGVSGATYTNVTPKFYYRISEGTLYITSDIHEGDGWHWNYEGSRNTWFDKYSGELTSTITSVVVSNYSPKSMYRLFADLTNVTNISFGDNINTSNTVNMTRLFENCKKIKKLDVSKLNTEHANLPNEGEPSDLFINCKSLKEVKYGENFGYTLSEGVWVDSNYSTNNRTYKNGVVTTNVNETYTRRTIYWGYNSGSKTLKISNNYVDETNGGPFDYYDYFDYANESTFKNLPWKQYANEAEHIIIGGENDIIAPIVMDFWFNGFKKVESIDLQYIDFTNVEEMVSTFQGMTSLKTIDLSGHNFDNLYMVDGMFKGCSSLEYINLEGFNPPYVESFGGTTFDHSLISGMFSGCSSLEEINLSSLEAPNTYLTAEMFYGCTSLKVLNISNFALDMSNFSSEDDYYGMFDDTFNLSQITIGENNIDFIKQVLPNPDPNYIEGSDGKWYKYNSSNELVGYDVSELTPGTYYATSPKTLSFYDSYTNALIKRDTYVYGVKIKLNVNSTRPNSTTPIITSFVTDTEQAIDSVETTKVSSYKLVGYTDNTNNYDYGSDLVLKADTNLYTVYAEDSSTYQEITLPVIERFGYIFKGWSKEQNQTNGITGAYEARTNETLYAVWEEIRHEYLDNPTSTFKIGKTKSLVFRINADLSLFKDLYVVKDGNKNKLTKGTHYTVESGSTVITFTNEGISYLENLAPGEYTINAEFSDQINDSTTPLLIKAKDNLLVIHYKYSGTRSEETVFPDYTAELEEGQEYSVTSQTKENYKFDQEVVSGKMGKQDIVITVTYTPLKDKNNNNIADQEENLPKENTNTEKSPKTKDNIMTYILLELLSLVAGVIIFIRIKAQ